MVEIQEIAGREWDEILLQFRDAVHEQTYTYAASRWGAGRVRCVVVSESGELVGGAAVLGVTLPWVERGIAAVKFGPLYRKWDENPPLTLAPKIAGALKEHFCGRLRRHLTIIPAPAVDAHDNWSHAGIDGFRGGGKISDARRYFIDLDLDESEQRSSLSGQWRRNLTLAEKRGVTAHEVSGAEGLGHLRNLLTDLAKRKPEVSLSGFNAMHSLLASPHAELRPRVFLASANGAVVAGAVVTTIGECASYVFGAQTVAGAAMCANYFLQWSIVQFLSRQIKWRWYDLGGDNESPGLIQFKTGFIGKKGRLVTIPRRLESSGGLISDAMSWAASRLRPP